MASWQRTAVLTALAAGLGAMAAGLTTSPQSARTGEARSPPPVVAPLPVATGTIRGVVRLADTAPIPEPVIMSVSSDEVMASLHPDGLPDPMFVCNDDRTVPNAFVELVGKIPTFGHVAPISEPALLHVPHGNFAPHVLGLRLGRELRLRNDIKT